MNIFNININAILKCYYFYLSVSLSTNHILVPKFGLISRWQISLLFLPCVYLASNLHSLFLSDYKLWSLKRQKQKDCRERYSQVSQTTTMMSCTALFCRHQGFYRLSRHGGALDGSLFFTEMWKFYQSQYSQLNKSFKNVDKKRVWKIFRIMRCVESSPNTEINKTL